MDSVTAVSLLKAVVVATGMILAMFIVFSVKETSTRVHLLAATVLGILVITSAIVSTLYF